MRISKGVHYLVPATYLTGTRGPQALTAPEYQRLYTDFLQKGSYLHINSPIIELIKINNGIGKQHHNPLTK